MQLSRIRFKGKEKNTLIDNADKHAGYVDCMLLSGFSENEISEVFELGYLQEYYLHDLIINEKQEHCTVYFVLDGIVSLWKMNAPVITLKKGEVFNESIMFFPGTDSMVARAEEETKIYKIDRDTFLDYFVSKPERLFKVFTLNTLASLQRKMVFYENRIAQLYHKIV